MHQINMTSAGEKRNWHLHLQNTPSSEVTFGHMNLILVEFEQWLSSVETTATTRVHSYQRPFSSLAYVIKFTDLSAPFGKWSRPPLPPDNDYPREANIEANGRLPLTLNALRRPIAIVAETGAVDKRNRVVQDERK